MVIYIYQVERFGGSYLYLFRPQCVVQSALDLCVLYSVFSDQQIPELFMVSKT